MHIRTTHPHTCLYTVLYKYHFNLVPVSLNEISNEWSKTNAPLHIKKVAEYYGVFEHLFGDADFTPYIHLNINYDHDTKKVPVYRGNIIKPNEVYINYK